MSGPVVREATPADAPGIRRLFARVFEKEMTAQEWSWKFERNPDGWFGVVAEANFFIRRLFPGLARVIPVETKLFDPTEEAEARSWVAA